MTGQEILNKFSIGDLRGVFSRADGSKISHVKPNGIYIVGWDETLTLTPELNSMNFMHARSQFVKTIFGQVICDAAGI